MSIFDVAAAPVVSAGAYSAGDIMGGLLEFQVSDRDNAEVILDAIDIAFKSAVVPSLTAVIFNAQPNNTTQTDNAAYSLHASDVFKLRGSLPINLLGGFMVDHGTPNTFHLGNLNLAIKPPGKKLYVLLVDNTGVTLASTSDLQVTLHGRVG